jgi:nitrogen fixation/metabolism regulation signal transduction histidine kinase
VCVTLYLGTDIGHRNHRYFVAFVNAVSLLILYIFIVSLYLLIVAAQESSFMDAIIHEPAAAVFSLFCLIMSFCLCSLSCYHFYLISQGLTTNVHIQLERLGHTAYAQRNNNQEEKSQINHHPHSDAMQYEAELNDNYDNPANNARGWKQWWLRYKHFFTARTPKSLIDFRSAAPPWLDENYIQQRRPHSKKVEFSDSV